MLDLSIRAGGPLSADSATAPGSTSQATKGTVRAASHSAVQDMSIVSVARAVDSWATAVDCTGVVDFDIENCDLQGNGVAMTNAVTLSVDAYSRGGSEVHVHRSSQQECAPEARTTPGLCLRA